MIRGLLSTCCYLVASAFPNMFFRPSKNRMECNVFKRSASNTRHSIMSIGGISRGFMDSVDSAYIRKS